jgi:uncharacterized damage-inducible protein DinB
MTPAERERVLTYLRETQENLLRATRNLSPTQLQYKPAPDRWSVAECLEHLAFTEGLVLNNINNALERPADSSTPGMSDNGVMQLVADRSNRRMAPEPIAPAGRWSHDQVVGEFESARKRTLDFVATTSAQLRQHTFPHPMLGTIDCYQWLLLVGAHGERHRAQAEEIIADAGFPRAAAAG